MILALDIGGANTKIALIENEKVIWRDSYYFPFWKYKDKFNVFLFDIVKENKKINIKINEIKGVGITMTAELSDAFQTKDEGVNFILNCIENVFKNLNNLNNMDNMNNIPVYVLSNNVNLISIDEARKNPYIVASANWVATSGYAAKKYENGILVDIGSTTTDIILIKDGKIAVKGKTDFKRLQTGELIYTGILRTNIAAVVDSVKINNKKTLVSSELFAKAADVYLILNKISEKNYACETADGRGKSRGECMARLARVVCADLNELSEEEIVEMAEYVKEKQVERIIDGIEKVIGDNKDNKIGNLIAVGIGSFLVKEIGERLNILVIELNINPAIALGLMVEGKN